MNMLHGLSVSLSRHHFRKVKQVDNDECIMLSILIESVKSQISVFEQLPLKRKEPGAIPSPFTISVNY